MAAEVEPDAEIIIGHTGTRVANAIPPNPLAERTGRGALAGRLDLSDGWDALEVNEMISRDFGFPAQ